MSPEKIKLRDEFAARIAVELASQSHKSMMDSWYDPVYTKEFEDKAEQVALAAYALADAMLKARAE